MLYSTRVAQREGIRCNGAFFMKSLRTPLLFSILLVLLLAAAGCGGGGGGSKVPSDAVATVKGEPILRTQVDRLLEQATRSYKQQKRTFPKAGTTEYKQLQDQAIQFLVQRVEFDQKAKAFGVKVAPKQIEARLTQIKKQYFGGNQKRYEKALKQQGLTDAQVRDDIRAQLVSEALFNRVTSKVSVSDGEAQDYYLKHPEQYATPESRDVRHILVKASQSALANRLYTQLCGPATKCLHQLKGADFPALAKKYSTDPGSKNSGGKLTISKGQTVPEFDKTAFALETGETSHPVKTQYGWHIIQALANTHPRKATPFKQVKAAIKQQLVSQRKQEATAKFTGDLKKEYEGEIKYAKEFEPPATTSTAAVSTGATSTTG